MDNLFKAAAENQTNLARQAVREGNSPVARKAYRIAVQAWRKAVEIHPSLINYLIGTETEYLRFVKSDNVYPEILDEIKRTVSEFPGILHAELETRLGRFHRTDLENVLHVAIRNGDVERRKRGSTFGLWVPSRPKEKGIGGIVGKLGAKLPFCPHRIERRLPASPPA